MATVLSPSIHSICLRFDGFIFPVGCILHAFEPLTPALIGILREIDGFAGGGFPLFPVPGKLPAVGPIFVGFAELNVEPGHRLFPAIGAVIARHLQQAEFAGDLGIVAEKLIDLVGAVE